MQPARKNAFMLLGLMTVIVFVGGLFVFERAEAPIVEEEQVIPDMSLTLTSSAFIENGSIPSKFTCDGENISPELIISNVPEGTKSFILVMDDPDIPESVKQARGIEKFNHWAVYNIPAETTVIKEGEVVGTGAQNGAGDFVYRGPCPPDREHRYIFRLYAVTGTLNFIKAQTLDEVESAAQGMMLERAILIGRYERTNVE